MPELSVIQSATALAGAAVALIALKGAESRKRTQDRTEQLRLAAAMLKQHNDSLETFLADPAGPESLKDLLISFSEAADDEDLAHDFVSFLASDKPQRQPPETRRLDDDLDSLRSHRVDLATAFETALTSGFVAMFLRWDSMAGCFNILVANTTTDRVREIRYASELADTERQRQRDRKLAYPPELEAACAA